jgi:hypothetical protein
VKTDDLVAMLATRIEPIDTKWSVLRYAFAIAGGTAAALAFTGGVLRFNPGLSRAVFEPTFWIRECYCAALGLLGLIAVTRLARPGVRLGFVPAVIGAVVLGMWVLGTVELLTALPQRRAHLLLGTTAAVCPFLIALVAAPLFIAFLWVLRGFAPTRLRMAGAAAGFAAGSVGALVYSLHCPELAAPFLGVWYLLGILIPSALGTSLGPKVLSW